MKSFQRLRVAVSALGALSLLALSSAFGRGLAPLSPVPMGLSAGACFSPLLRCLRHSCNVSKCRELPFKTLKDTDGSDVHICSCLLAVAEEAGVWAALCRLQLAASVLLHY